MFDHSRCTQQPDRTQECVFLLVLCSHCFSPLWTDLTVVDNIFCWQDGDSIESINITHPMHFSENPRDSSKCINYLFYAAEQWNLCDCWEVKVIDAPSEVWIWCVDVEKKPKWLDYESPERVCKVRRGARNDACALATIWALAMFCTVSELYLNIQKYKVGAYFWSSSKIKHYTRKQTR